MVVYTDSINFAEQTLPQMTRPWSPPAKTPVEIENLTANLYHEKPYRESRLDWDPLWQYLILTETSSRSQYDLLIERSRDDRTLPNGLLCLTGAGSKLHGFKNRSWSASAGNIHLSIHLAPARPIDHFGTGFTVLAAVSVVEAIDALPGLNGRSGIKWVNDILVEGAKVCGVLAYTQTMKDLVSSAILGIGLNVETAPPVEPTPYVPRAAALRDFAPEPGACNQRTVLRELIDALGRNYRLLLDRGYNVLLDRYRERSLITGREVTIRSDDFPAEPEVIASGRVIGMGENLELYLEGSGKPVSRGRLILHPEVNS